MYRIQFLVSASLLSALLFAWPAQAQLDPDNESCAVVSQPLDVNEEGRLARPPPTLEECVIADELLARVMSKDRTTIARVVTLEPVPGNVRIYVGRMAPPGSPWRGMSSVSSLPNQRYIASFISEDIVIVVYQEADFGGPTNTVIVADLVAQKVCKYPRWPDSDDPSRMSIEDIQDILSAGVFSNGQVPVCHLESLVAE